MAFKLKNFLSGIKSKANTNKLGIKEKMQRKYGTDEYKVGGKKFEERMKPGESKFKYDVRMRKQQAGDYKKRTSGIDPSNKTGMVNVVIDGKVTSVPAEDRFKYESVRRVDENIAVEPPVNPNDLTDKSKPQNFGIKSGMTFGEAFAQAGKGGARAGQDPFFWINPDLVKNPEQISETFLYDFEKEEEEVKINPLTGAPEGSEIIQGKYGKVSTLPL